MQDAKCNCCTGIPGHRGDEEGQMVAKEEALMDKPGPVRREKGRTEVEKQAGPRVDGGSRGLMFWAAMVQAADCEELLAESNRLEPSLKGQNSCKFQDILQPTLHCPTHKIISGNSWNKSQALFLHFSRESTPWNLSCF